MIVKNAIVFNSLGRESEAVAAARNHEEPLEHAVTNPLAKEGSPLKKVRGRKEIGVMMLYLLHLE